MRVVKMLADGGGDRGGDRRHGRGVRPRRGRRRWLGADQHGSVRHPGGPTSAPSRSRATSSPTASGCAPPPPIPDGSPKVQDFEGVLVIRYTNTSNHRSVVRDATGSIRLYRLPDGTRISQLHGHNALPVGRPTWASRAATTSPSGDFVVIGIRTASGRSRSSSARWRTSARRSPKPSAPHRSRRPGPARPVARVASTLLVTPLCSPAEPGDRRGRWWSRAADRCRAGRPGSAARRSRRAPAGRPSAGGGRPGRPGTGCGPA